MLRVVLEKWKIFSLRCGPRTFLKIFFSIDIFIPTYIHVCVSVRYFVLSNDCVGHRAHLVTSDPVFANGSGVQFISKVGVKPQPPILYKPVMQQLSELNI